MNTLKSILLLVLLAAFAHAGDIQDIELVTTANGTTLVSVASSGVAGWINSVGVDVASGSTGTVSVTLTPSPSTLSARTIVSTNSTVADVWFDPSDSASRRYAVTEKDVLTMTVTNESLTAKQYRAVIRLERAK